MDTIKTKKIFFILLGMALFGIIYFFTIWVDISKISSSSRNFSFTINSKIEQNVNFHIQVEQNRTTLKCNNQTIMLDRSKKHDYFYRGEEQINIPLKRGDNICQAVDMRPKIRQKIDFLDFIILFILWGVPLFQLLFLLFIWIMNRIKSFISNKIKNIHQTTPPQHFSLWIVAILLIGIAVRVAYFQKYGIVTFQHDWQGHIEFIKYIAQNGSLPTIPMKGWEFPQQPLYYIITGGLYHLFIENGFSDQEALYNLGYFSIFCSIVFLYYSYRLVMLLTESRFVQMIAMIFLSLTPSIVYLSARINNDSLVIALSVMAMYYVIKSYQKAFQKGFYGALALVTLLFLTKVSTAGVEILLFILLIINYLKSSIEREPLAKSQLYLYGIVGIFILSIMLIRLYMPLEDSFYMVNSAKFPKQTIDSLDWSYFLSFHIIDLIKVGESYVFGEDSIRHSFLTYQYGTMFFGEFDYAFWINKNFYLHIAMQLVLISGSLFIVGFIVYTINLWRESLLSKTVFTILFINFILVIKFIVMYPSICNTDFRYFVGSFALLAFIFGKGLNYLYSNPIIKKIINCMLGILVVSELLFFLFLIY